MSEFIYSIAILLGVVGFLVSCILLKECFIKHDKDGIHYKCSVIPLAIALVNIALSVILFIIVTH